MSSAFFINTMRGFVSIRMKVKEFRSDKGTNFVGAASELGISVESGSIKESLQKTEAILTLSSCQRCVGKCAEVDSPLFLLLPVIRQVHEVHIMRTSEVRGKLLFPTRLMAPQWSIAIGPRIISWWNSQMSGYGKNTCSVSGQGRKQLTARKERLKERLAFLSAHVYRVPKRAGVDFFGLWKIEDHGAQF
ncbi:hypothetical protein ScPMuIL_015929 [Solemya velum]